MRVPFYLEINNTTLHLYSLYVGLASSQSTFRLRKNQQTKFVMEM
jgi:hypothetical protein